jgi:pimeloyl-ACP methyl ester carboxylesterase
MPFEKINNRNVFYEVHGEGETIVLMHHGFGCSKIWKKIYPALVDRGYKVLMYDRRGYGQSEPGEGFQEYYEGDQFRPESVIELRAVLDFFDIKECHLVGQCEAGVIGVDYSIKYPGQVKTLSTSSTQCYSEMPMEQMTAMKFVSKFVDLPPSLQDKMRDWHGERAEAAYNQFAKYGGAYGVGYFDLRPVLPFVPCPTLIIFPDRSSIFDVEQSVAFYRHLIKGELAVFARCGHNTYEQRPEDYVHTLLAFIDRNKAGADPTSLRPSGTCLA